jgi:isopentenyldiphosphate isomerase
MFLGQWSVLLWGNPVCSHPRRSRRDEHPWQTRTRKRQKSRDLLIGLKQASSPVVSHQADFA